MTVIAFPATEAQWIAAYRVANLLARDGFLPLWATRAFTAMTTTGETLSMEAGTVLLTGEDAARAPALVALADRFGIAPVALTDAAGASGVPLRPIRIAVYGGGGAPYNHGAAYAELGFLTDFIFPEDILAGALSGYDLLAVPGGGARAMQGQLDPLGEAGCRAIADFVRRGGTYLGCCAGAFDASLVAEGFLTVCPQQKHMQMINAAVWNSGDQMWGLQSPGVGVIRAQVASTHPVTYGMPAELPITHYNGPLYHLPQETVVGASDAVGLLRVVGTEDGFTPSERFLDSDADPESLLVGRAATFGAYNAVAGEYGRGRVVLFGSHPEMGLSLDMDNWDAPARMLANAAFWQASSGDARRQDRTARDYRAAAASSMRGLKVARQRIDAIVEHAEALASRDAGNAGWLEEALAMSTFGVPADEIWRRNLAGFQPGALAMQQVIGEIEQKIGAALDTLDGSGASESALATTLDELDLAVNYRTPPSWDIDVGYEGLLQHLDRADAMIAKAEANFDTQFAPDPNPYAYITESPFQLAVGSYLSAAGVFANCKLLLQLNKAKLDNAFTLAEARRLAA